MIVFFCLLLLTLLFPNYIYAQTTAPCFENSYITALTTTPSGVLAGEFDSRIWQDPPPYNGIYITRDLGKTWEPLGLETQGIIDLAYSQNKLYAATFYSYYNKPPGGYISKDGGKTWEFLNKKASPTKITANESAILLGTKHMGLWVTFDEGQTWEQKIGNAMDGTYIKALQSHGELAISATRTKVYLSQDQGKTWVEIPSLADKDINVISIWENTILAASSQNPGLYRSTDRGITWQSVTKWNTALIANIHAHKGWFYLTKLTPSHVVEAIYTSKTLGVTWEELDLTIIGTISKDLAGIFAQTNQLFVATNKQTCSYITSSNNVTTYPFLQIPWKQTYPTELVDTVTSFFDHEYPLLGYGYHGEPPPAKTTTLNYLGIRKNEPEMYYSSHDGYDYALPYGTPILAAASGFAWYHECKPCGHTIKINHPSGYQTTYMHLQQNQLVTTQGPIWIEKGTQIGLVGMTGNTTGPHLHFSVVEDKNGNGTATDDSPEGRVDPYGWEAPFQDPWEQYNWTDILGTHVGSKSTYLWQQTLIKATEYTHTDPTTINIDNKTVQIPPQEKIGITVTAMAFLKPKLPPTQKHLKYIPNTSLLIEAFDHLGNILSNLKEPAQIEIDLSDSDLSNVSVENLTIYVLNETTNTWEPIQTLVDFMLKKLIGEIPHLSQFAVFGEMIDSKAPTTIPTIHGQKENSWFTEYPTITLETTNPKDKIFYAIEGDKWLEYTQPFVVSEEGILTLRYRAMDTLENLETTQEYTLKIDTLGKFKKKVKIQNVTYEVATTQ